METISIILGDATNFVNIKPAQSLCDYKSSAKFVIIKTIATNNLTVHVGRGLLTHRVTGVTACLRWAGGSRPTKP